MHLPPNTGKDQDQQSLGLDVTGTSSKQQGCQTFPFSWGLWNCWLSFCESEHTTGSVFHLELLCFRPSINFLLSFSQMLSYSAEQCLTEDKRCRCGVKKGGNLVHPPTPGNGLIYGFQMVTGMFIWTLPKLPEPLGSAKIRLQISWAQTFFSGVGGWGWWWLRFPVLPVLELLEMRQKVYFRISVPGPSWNMHIQMCTEKGHVCTSASTRANTYRGASYVLTKIVFKTRTQCFPFPKKKKKKMRLNSKTFHNGLSKFQNQTEQQSDLGGNVYFLIIFCRWARSCWREKRSRNKERKT